MPREHSTPLTPSSTPAPRAARHPPFSLICRVCGREVSVAWSRRRTAKYCSRECCDTGQRAGLRAWQCETCGGTFYRRDKFGKRRFRFCGRSCMGLWRWTQDGFRARAEAGIRAAAQDPQQRAASSARMRANNPMTNPETREKMRRALRGRTFLARGGNGQMTTPQIMLADALGLPMEYAIPTAAVAGKFPSLPHNYKVDIADPEEKVAIEVDGKSHQLRKWKFFDRRKTEVLNVLGWRVIRFTNEEVLSDLWGTVERSNDALGRSQPAA